MATRTRFAPSPTGPLHMGNARTALFNYLFTKKEGGEFLLRIEDTDKERSKPEWEKDLLDNLTWMGISWDEGPKEQGTGEKGKFGPFRQSERTKIYQEYLQKLLNAKKAYWCFCTEDELEAQRQDQASRGVAPYYKGTCKALSEKEQEEKLKQGIPAVIRFAVQPKKVIFQDLIRGEVSFDMSLSGDFVIARNLESPLYNFSVVVDDYLMKITHVIRGEDHISNTPKQVLLKEALGIPQTLQYAHLPLILGEDRTKLSKRHGDNSVTRFRKQGYLPEAVVNFLALLGWNPGDEREIFSLQQLQKEFSLQRVQKGGAVFNISRLDWINGFYLRQKEQKRLGEITIPHLIEAGLLKEANGPENNKTRLKLKIQKAAPYIVQETGESISVEKIGDMLSLYRDRIKKLSDAPQLADFFFKKELSYEKELLRWKEMTDKDVQNALAALEDLLSKISEENWNREYLEKALMPEAEKTGLPAEASAKAGDRGVLLWPLRVALTGKKASAGPFEIAGVLGKEKTLQRIQQAKEKVL